MTKIVKYMGGTRGYLRGLAILGLIGFIASSCLTAPEFPNEPIISFSNITFEKGATDFDPDSLALTINFQDGNGDIGLRSEGIDTREPYQDLWAFDNVNDPTKLVTYADRFTPEYDTLPAYEFPYYCINYDIFGNDTVYVQPNEYHHNIFVRFFVKKNGEYTEFDWLTSFDPVCGATFDGRYPLLNDLERERPLEGTLKYKMKSAGFELLFRQDTLKLDVWIYDRALNKSNKISTPDFVLKDITVGG